jgi:pimeloyl-ACP methyl ester carboxylesterase
MRLPRNLGRMRRRPSREAPPARLSDASLPSVEDVTAWPGRTVQVRGQDIFVRSTPATADGAEPALLVHGLGGSATNWTDYAGLLRHRLDIEALDLPGFGKSGPARDNDYSLDAHVRTVIDYLEQSGRGPVHLVGNSMGGAISLLVASRRPDLVRTLTVISPAVPDLKIRVHVLKTDWRFALLLVPMVGAVALRKLGAVPTETRVKGTIALCFADPTRLSDARFKEMVDEASARAANPWVDVAMLRSTRGLVRSMFFQARAGWAAMRTIKAPTLVLWGEQDKLVAADLAPFVAAAIPDSRLLVLDDVGHVAMMEDPETAARATLALVDDATAGVPAREP